MNADLWWWFCVLYCKLFVVWHRVDHSMICANAFFPFFICRFSRPADNLFRFFHHSLDDFRVRVLHFVIVSFMFFSDLRVNSQHNTRICHANKLLQSASTYTDRCVCVCAQVRALDSRKTKWVNSHVFLYVRMEFAYAQSTQTIDQSNNAWHRPKEKFLHESCPSRHRHRRDDVWNVCQVCEHWTQTQFDCVRATALSLFHYCVEFLRSATAVATKCSF